MKHLLFRSALLFLTLCSAWLTANAQIVPAPTEKQLSAIEKIMAPQRKKVTDILDADKTGQYKIYQNDLKALSQEKDPAQKKVLADKIRRDHYIFIKAAFVAAKIDLKAIRPQISDILKTDRFTLDEFGGLSSSTFLPKFELPLKFDSEIVCPFDSPQEVSNGGGLAGCSSTVETCRIFTDANSYILAGGCRNKASLGGKFELPSGNFQKITVAAQFDAFYYGNAAVLGGYGQFNVKIGVRLQGPGLDKVVIVHDAWCIAPVIFFSQIEMDADNFLAQAVFTGSFAGENLFTAQAYNGTFAIPGLIGTATGFSISSNFDFIRVKATN